MASHVLVNVNKNQIAQFSYYAPGLQINNILYEITQESKSVALELLYRQLGEKQASQGEE